MRILIDTNILISASMFRGTAISNFFSCAQQRDHIILTDTIIDEAREVINNKWPNELKRFDTFFRGYETRNK